MDQLEYALSEIRQHGKLSPVALGHVEDAIAAHRNRMKTQFPNYDLFTTGTGQSYGLMMEKRIIASFADMTKHEGDSAYDAEWNNQRIEIKSLKCTRGESSEYIGNRIVNLDTETNRAAFGTGSFQQVKPCECDWFVFHILYGNAERLFLVPSKMFSTHPGKENKEPGKLLLSSQHRNHQTEGQANMGTVLAVADLFEVARGYSSAQQGHYAFADLIQIVTQRMEACNWTLPEETPNASQAK